MYQPISKIRTCERCGRNTLLPNCICKNMLYTMDEETKEPAEETTEETVEPETVEETPE